MTLSNIEHAVSTVLELNMELTVMNVLGAYLHRVNALLENPDKEPPKLTAISSKTLMQPASSTPVIASVLVRSNQDRPTTTHADAGPDTRTPAAVRLFERALDKYPMPTRKLCTKKAKAPPPNSTSTSDTDSEPPAPMVPTRKFSSEIAQLRREYRRATWNAVDVDAIPATACKCKKCGSLLTSANTRRAIGDRLEELEERAEELEERERELRLKRRRLKARE